MANVIIPDAQRQREARKIMESYGADRRDPAMREAAEVAAARTNEAIKEAGTRRRYY